MSLFKNSFHVGDLEVNADAYSELFETEFVRFDITANDPLILINAAQETTRPSALVIGGTEGGIEKRLCKEETPDGREGVRVQIYRRHKSKKLTIGERIRQGTLIRLGTAIFDYNRDCEKKYDTMKNVGFCGDGHQELVKKYGREMIKIPLARGDFYIENGLGLGKGIAGGDILYFCNNELSEGELTRKVTKAVRKVDGAIAPFEICGGASKLGSDMAEKYKGTKLGEEYKAIGPTTNQRYCPTLRNKIPDSEVPEGITSIPETIINGINIDVVKTAMKEVIETVSDIRGVLGVSSVNFGGRLGKYKIYLKDLF